MAAKRRLIVMRHAKAGELPGGPDSERALRPRGRRDAGAAGEWLAANDLVPELVLCSAARRARQTWDEVSRALGAVARPIEVRFDQRLYAAAGDALLAILAQAPASRRCLMYLGHNPAAADLTEFLIARPIDFATAGLAVVGLDLAWEALADPVAAPGAGELAATWTPRAGG